VRTQELAVVSIHPDPSNPLGLDLKHILSALHGKLDGCVWQVKGVDWLGDNADVLREAFEAAAPGGYWLDSRELIEAVSGIYQTIEGEFTAFPAGSIAWKGLAASDHDLSTFPTSQATLAVVAVDGCYFDVYAKDPEVVRLLREAFPDVRTEDPARYFA